MPHSTSGTNSSGRRKFRPYPKYKDSGVEWLGKIPVHWKIIPIRLLAKHGYKTFIDGDWIESPFIRDEGIRLIQTGNIGIGEYKEQGYRYIDDRTFNLFRCTEVFPGDVLICRLADPVGRACLAPDLGCRMITSVDVCILKTAPHLDPRYVVYALSNKGYLQWLSSICRGGTRDRISRSMLSSISIQIPPSEEQYSISMYLEQELAKIDALIEKKERLIELLQEKRTGFITQAVTKGLDPTVPMKDSGIEWLGEIPRHWNVVSLKRRTKKIQTGTTPPTGETKYYEEGVIPWYGPGSFTEGLPLKEPVKYVTDGAIKDGVARIFEADSSLIVTIGTIGKVALMERPGSFNQQITGVMFDPHQVSPRYGAYQLKNLEQTIHGIAPNTTLPIIDQEVVGYLPLIIPPLLDQERIAAFLDRETAKIDSLKAKIQDAIDRLREFRSALISAAVTGRIDIHSEMI